VLDAETLQEIDALRRGSSCMASLVTGPNPRWLPHDRILNQVAGLLPLKVGDLRSDGPY